VRPKLVLYYNDLIFQPSESFLFKDFGQVPYVLAELNHAEVEYWVAASTTNPAFDRFRGKPVRQFAKAFRKLTTRLDCLKNGELYRAVNEDRGLTHLILFPFTPLTDLFVARLAARRGARVIVKLDTNRNYLETLAADWARVRRYPIRFARQCHHYRELLRLADLVVCETNDCARILRDGFLDLDLDEKLVQTFSGVSERWLSALGVEEVADVDRRRSIIVSGRISSWQKHTALIFEAGPPPPGWRIEFIGPVDEALEDVIERYRQADCDFDKKYRFHGSITEKRAYFDILMRAKDLLMNSRGGEGFPNVFAEAHYCRLFIVTSDVSGATEATADGRFGLIYRREDVSALRTALQAVPERVARFNHEPDSEAYRQRFIWEHSLDQPQFRRVFEDCAGRAAS
jgi:glycosyltransferase involved in cell wall biosynthesis